MSLRCFDVLRGEKISVAISGTEDPAMLTSEGLFDLHSSGLPKRPQGAHHHRRCGKCTTNPGGCRWGGQNEAAGEGEEQGCISRGAGGGLKGGGGGAGLAGTPLLPGPPCGPRRRQGGPKYFKRKPSWRRNKILAVSLKHWKGKRGVQGVAPPLLNRHAPARRPAAPGC